MKRLIVAISALVAGALCLGMATEANAGGRKSVEPGPYITEHPKSPYYRKKRGAQVRGFVARRGGYSYTYADSINTYGDSRSLYGSTWLFRNPYIDRQTTAGPFDHGFFFDSGVMPRGGDSPYMH